MTAENLKNWLKTKDSELSGCISAGAIDSTKEKYVGVYNSKRYMTARRCIGTEPRYSEKRFTILVHWTKSDVEAQKKAEQLRKVFLNVKNENIDGVKVVCVDPGEEPVRIGKDDKNIFEYVIELKTISERS